MRTRRVIGGLACAALLAGCSSTVVDGHPGRARAAGASSSRVSSSASSSGASSSGASSGALVTDPTTVRRIEADAKADLVATNTYSYRTLPADLRNGLAHTTGTYRLQYRQAFTRLVEKQAPRLHAGQTITITVVALQTRTTSAAQVLAAVQTRTVQGGAKPRLEPVTASLSLTEVAGRWLLSALSTRAVGPTLGPVGNSGLAAAARATTVGVTDILGLSRAHFDSDYARALAATTGALHEDLRSRESSYRSTLTRGHFDVTAHVDGVGVVSAGAGSAVFLLAVESARSTAPSTPSYETLEVTTRLVDGHWLLSKLASVGLR